LQNHISEKKNIQRKTIHTPLSDVHVTLHADLCQYSVWLPDKATRYREISRPIQQLTGWHKSSLHPATSKTEQITRFDGFLTIKHRSHVLYYLAGYSPVQPVDYVKILDKVQCLVCGA